MCAQDLDEGKNNWEDESDEEDGVSMTLSQYTHILLCTG